MGRPLRSMLSWLHAVLRPRAHRAAIEDELRVHLDHEIEALMATGLDRREAERRARARLGNAGALHEECREARGTRALDVMVQDIRYAARLVSRDPAFSATAVLTLAFTIGAVSTVLTLIDTFYLKRWPVDRAEEIVEVLATRDEGTRAGFVSWAEYDHFRAATRTLDGLAAAYTGAPLHVTSADDVVEVTGAAVSANLFPMLGLGPEHGRFFRPDEDAVAGRDRVVAISHDFFHSWFGGDPEAIGTSLEINGVTFRVIGVVPRRFVGFDATPVQIYMPTMMLGVAYRWCAVLEDPDCTILQMFGRRADGVTTATVRAEMATLHPPRWERRERGSNSGTAVRETRGTYQSEVDRQFIVLLVVLCTVLFAVCCANLAGLMAARGRARGPEISTRAALGASPRRLLAQLLTEALVVAVLGGIAGIGLSLAFTRALEAGFYTLDSSGRPLAYDFTVRPEIVAWTLAIALLAGLGFGLLPARGLVRRTTDLRRGDGTRVVASSQRWLLGLQAASAVALIVIATLISASVGARSRDANVDPSRVALLRLRPRLVDFPPAAAQRYVREVMTRIESLAAVESVSAVGTGIALMGLSTEVRAGDGRDDATRAGYIEVGPRYFETLRIPMLRGREFESSDDTSAPPVAVVSAALARRLWAEGDALGASIRVNDVVHTVVGISEDVALQARGELPRPYVFVPFWQNPDQVDARLQVRVNGDPGALLAALAAEARRVDPRVPVTETITLQWRLAGMFRPLRMSALGAAYAGALAVALSALGLYASLANAVTRRRREIGVRQAIGASPERILAMVAREGMRVIAAAVAAGTAIAFVSTRLLRHMLYGAAADDVAVYALGAVLVSLVGLCACLVPARRAARIEPMRALREG